MRRAKPLQVQNSSEDKSSRPEKNIREQDAPRDANKGGTQEVDKDKSRDADRVKNDANRESRDGDRDRTARDTDKNRHARDSDREGKRTEGRDQREGDRDGSTRDADRDRNTRDKDRDSSHGRRSAQRHQKSRALSRKSLEMHGLSCVE